MLKLFSEHLIQAFSARLLIFAGSAYNPKKSFEDFEGLGQDESLLFEKFRSDVFFTNTEPQKSGTSYLVDN